MPGMYYLRLIEPRLSAMYRSRHPNASSMPADGAARFDLAPYLSAASAPAASVLAAGTRYLGTPYELGAGRGEGIPTAIDCSAFVARAYADATRGRVNLTPYTDAMYQETAAVNPADARPGDLVFYSGGDASQPNTRFPHVALYAGNGQVLDASSLMGRVAYHSIGIGPHYRYEFRRPLGV